MFVLNSTGFRDGFILEKYGKKSEQCISGVPQLSFPLSWENAPTGAVSYAIVFQDYDNIPDEGVSWLHWLISDIPSSMTELNEDASRQDLSLVQGSNSWICPLGDFKFDKEITAYYGGPAPERDHEYEVSIYALDIYLGLENGFFYNELRRKMEGHIIAEAVLKGIYRV
jgi:Raf kinase inhibitor-like YbhB/YbcL family protein